MCAIKFRHVCLEILSLLRLWLQKSMCALKFRHVCLEILYLLHHGIYLGPFQRGGGFFKFVQVS